MIGRTLSHCKVLEGRGGMGDVYRGTDLEIDREVAFMVLAPELVADPEYVPLRDNGKTGLTR